MLTAVAVLSTLIYVSGPANAAGYAAKPSSDVSTTGWTSSGANFWSTVDEDAGTPDDNDYVTGTARSAAGSDTITFGLGTMPANLGAVTAVTVTFRHAEISSGLDQIDVTSRVFKSDGTTPLTNATTAVNSTSSTPATATPAATMSGPATEADWDNARLSITNTWVNGTAAQERIYLAAVNITYTEAAMNPNVPTSLAQTRISGSNIPLGGVTTETSVRFTALVSDGNSSDTLYLCVEKDTLGTNFSNTEDQCSAGVAYAGTPVLAEVTVTGLVDDTEYHWQARVKDAAGAYSSSWAAFGGNAESARDFKVDDDLVVRSNTVEFFAGQHTGATAANDEQKIEFSDYTFSLAESGVAIADAFVEISAQVGSTTAKSYASTYIYFDACTPTCTPSTTAYLDDADMGADSGESQNVRLRAKVSGEDTLAAYTGGGAVRTFRVGYCFSSAASSCSGTPSANIYAVTARLVVTYTFDATATNRTGTVRYPLESSTTGPVGSKTAAMNPADCTMDSDCPKFNYNAQIPEITNDSQPGSTDQLLVIVL